ncbi:hypothetical protein Leryth_024397 [Lithospermum erythrorhizon]|nr:hypothetical protein Leryth_024397 [Lithospermum erythrorhizon]
MDISEIAKKLGLKPPVSKPIIRKAAELRRFADTQFDSSVIGVGEICKAVICLEIAANGLDVMIDRAIAIKLSGMSERAYIRSFNSMQNAIGVKNKVDIRELAIRFGCVRIIPYVTRGLSLYKDRFLASLPPTRRASTDFTRPVLTAVAFYLSSKKHKLNVDKIKLIELCGTSESEFASVVTSMSDLCFDVFGTSKEKKDPREIKGNRGEIYANLTLKHLYVKRASYITGFLSTIRIMDSNYIFFVLFTSPDLLDALPEKRRVEDGGCSSDEEKVIIGLGYGQEYLHYDISFYLYLACKFSICLPKSLRYIRQTIIVNCETFLSHN